MLIKLCLYLVFSCDPYLHSFSATYGKDLGWSHRPTQCDLIIPCIHYKGGQNIKENTEKKHANVYCGYSLRRSTPACRLTTPSPSWDLALQRCYFRFWYRCQSAARSLRSWASRRRGHGHVPVGFCLSTTTTLRLGGTAVPVLPLARLSPLDAAAIAPRSP